MGIQGMQGMQRGTGISRSLKALEGLALNGTAIWVAGNAFSLNIYSTNGNVRKSKIVLKQTF